MHATFALSQLDGPPQRPVPDEMASRARPGAAPKPRPLARAALRAAAALAPAPTARALARRFLTPRRVRLEDRERSLIAAAERIALPFAAVRPGRGAHPRSVVAYLWGGDGPTVLLAHGWSSAAGQLAALIEPLRRLGFRVAAFDAPAHGASSGTSTSAVEIAEVVLAAGRVLGPLHAVIGHSAGATAAARAVAQGLPVGRLALVSPWTRPQIWVERFAATFRLSRSMRARLVRAVEAEVGERLHAFDLEVIAPALANPTLVVHDRGDALVDVADVRAAVAALPAGMLVETCGLGHSRTLRASEVVARVVEFVARDAADAPRRSAAGERAGPAVRSGGAIGRAAHERQERRPASSAAAPLRLSVKGFTRSAIAGAVVVLGTWVALWGCFLATLW